MSYSELEKKLKELKIEDFIWVIYIGIIYASWYANHLERNYFLYNDQESKKKYRQIMITIFSILIIIYYYFVQDSVEDIKNIRPSDSPQKKELLTLSLVGSLLIITSGIIFLYIALKDEDIEVELAFN